MQQKHPPHVPTEIMRTVIAIAESGSLTKAAERLALSQPAVTAQVKRLQRLVGGNIFLKGSNGTTPTEFGKLVITQARRMLEANDQLFFLGGNYAGKRPIRLGLSTLFVAAFLESQNPMTFTNTSTYADHSSVVRKGLADGYIDVACYFAPKNAEADPDCTIIAEIDCPMVWIRSKQFALSPGMPIPIVTIPEDDWMISPFSKSGLPYQIVFHSPDYFSRLCAVRAGIGLTATLPGLTPPDLVEAKDAYLPKLPAVKAVLCVRSNFETKESAKLLQFLTKFFNERFRTTAVGSIESLG
jgi:DNA-binding transcriptional LysR family regulator